MISFSKKYKEFLINYSKLGFWQYDVINDRLEWSDITYHLHELDPGLGRPSIDDALGFYTSESLPNIKNAFRRSIDEQKEFDLDLRIKTKNGNLKWVRVVGVPVIDDGLVVKVIGSFQDVDENKKKTELLEVLTERFNLATTAASVGIWDWKIQENVLVWDESMYRLYGVRKSYFSGAYEAWKATLHPHDEQKAEKAIEEALKGIKNFNLEFRIQTPSGEIKHIRAIANTIRDPKTDEPLRMLGANWDVTEEKLREQELIKAKEQALEAAKTKARFLANMSHEIRTPMNGLLGMIQVLKQSEMSEDQKSFIKTIVACGQSLLNIVNEILYYSKLESGETNLKPIETDIGDLVDSLTPLFMTTLKSNVEYKAYVSKSVPKWVIVDEKLVRQIIVNVINNAIKFTPLGRVELKVETSNGSLKFTVKDTGVGIEKKDFKKLFKPFSQLDDSRTRVAGGTGLGLAICRNALDVMGGSIKVKSARGVGTEVKFLIPYKSSSKETSKLQELEKNKADFDLSALRVLVVEDNVVNVRVIGFMLKKLGIEFDKASQGLEAVELCQGSDYDLILMDVHMPVMDGLEASTLILKHHPDALICALSASVLAEDRKACSDAGMQWFLAKPISLDLLKEVLRSAAQNKAEKEKLAS